MKNLKRGSIIRHDLTGDRYKVTSVFSKNKSVHCVMVREDGTLHPHRQVRGFTFQQIKQSMTIEEDMTND